MDSLNIQLFYVPTIALVSVIGCYFYFLNKVNEKKSYRAFFLSVALFAYLFNFIWEVTQGFLYEGFMYDVPHVVFCALATVADVFMVLLLYFGYSFYFGDVFWIRKLNFGKVVSLVVIGGLGAVIGETIHLAADNWAYTNSMPLLPMVNAGLAPVLQFMILPVLTYWLSFGRQRAKADLRIELKTS